MQELRKILCAGPQWKDPLLWQDSDFMARAKQLLPIHVRVFHYPEEVIALAPQWTSAVGTGANAKDALEELQEMLQALKEDALGDAENMLFTLRRIPLQSSQQIAEQWCKFNAEWFADLERESTKNTWHVIRI